MPISAFQLQKAQQQKPRAEPEGRSETEMKESHWKHHMKRIGKGFRKLKIGRAKKFDMD